jgi:hypothetical protein
MCNYDRRIIIKTIQNYCWCIIREIKSVNELQYNDSVLVNTSNNELISGAISDMSAVLFMDESKKNEIVTPNTTDDVRIYLK